MIVLGINWGHDSSAALMIDGELVCAFEEERFSRKKHTKEFPKFAIQACLATGDLKIDDVDEVAYTMNPRLTLDEYYLKPALLADHRVDMLIEELDRMKLVWNMPREIRSRLDYDGTVTACDHHLCHIASSFFPSGFYTALSVSYDGVGEYTSSLMATCSQQNIQISHQGNKYPHSLGLIYAAVTDFLGWKYNCDEGIVMGLAALGDANSILGPKSQTYIDYFREIIQIDEDFGYNINLNWVTFHKERSTWVSQKFIDTFGVRRSPGSDIEQNYANVAAALQLRLEEVVMQQLKLARSKFGLKNLTVAGGVGLNCSLNGKIYKSKLFDEIFIQPGSGDNGTAIGSCFLTTLKNGHLIPVKKRHNYYLGSTYDKKEILNALNKAGIKAVKSQDIYKETSKALEQGKIVGWFQGHAEFGPRALGNRSILAKPFPVEMKHHINSRVKFRENFRPFAPAVMANHANEYFEMEQESSHMLIACDIKKEKMKDIEAVAHIDGTARVQTVTEQSNLRFFKLLKAFKELTGCPVLLNTSFNVKGQPIVNNPGEAIDCFLGTQIDCLVIGDYVVEKST